jgi:hypothetical protein
MYGSEHGEVYEDDWSDVKSSLSSVGTEEVLNQLGAMNEADVVYNGWETEWSDEDIVENYRKMLDAFGGEQNLDQYIDIGGLGVTVAVEDGDEPVFVVYGEDEVYDEAGRFGLGFVGTPS